jgi:hypothetical protein
MDPDRVFWQRRRKATQSLGKFTPERFFKKAPEQEAGKRQDQEQSEGGVIK